MTNFEMMRRRLEAPLAPPAKVDAWRILQELERTEWSPAFERLMRNRLIMGSMRYGRFGSPNKGSYDSVSSAIQRLRAFQQDGNLEHLVDAANLCMVEFIEGHHPRRHFRSTDDAIHASRIL